MQRILIQWQHEVEKRKEELIKTLMHFLQIESTFDPTTANEKAPFGASIGRALEDLLQMAENDGFDTKNVDGYAGHVEWGTGEELIGVLAHLDVVPSGNEDDWHSPPFQPQIRDGKIFARGAIDDKGPLIAAYFALKLMKELDLPLSRRIRLIVGTDEETHWRCMKRYFQTEEQPLIGFTPDADFPIIIGEKGFLEVILQRDFSKSRGVDQADWQLLSFQAGERSNKVPDLAVAKLEGEGDVFALKEQYQDFLLQRRIHGYAEESDEGVHLILKGVAHHAFEPEKGINAALVLSQFLRTISLDEQGRQVIDFLNRYFVDSFAGEKLGIADQDDVLGHLTINLGVCSYQRDEQQTLHLSIRYPQSTDGEQLVERLKDVLTPEGVQVNVLDMQKPHLVDPDHELIRKLRSVYEQQTGQPADLLTTGGATYARTINQCVAFGAIFPGHADTSHQANEYIEIEALLKATAIYAQAIYELAQKE
jgi:succinyl-diaminopimelate desuccinylase